MMMYAHALVLNASEQRSYQSPGIDISLHVNLLGEETNTVQ